MNETGFDLGEIFFVKYSGHKKDKKYSGNVLKKNESRATEFNVKKICYSSKQIEKDKFSETCLKGGRADEGVLKGF